MIIIKSLLTSLYKREGYNPSLVKRGRGDFLKNIIHSIMRPLIYPKTIVREYCSNYRVRGQSVIL